MLNFFKKASFTVEAAYIVPLMLVFIAGLLGFTYFTHHQNWCKGAAYESLYYALQRNTTGEAAAEIAGHRLEDRILEIPLDVSDISSEVTEGVAGLKAEMKSGILPDYFDGLFMMEQSVQTAKIDAPALKKAGWIAKYIKDTFGS